MTLWQFIHEHYASLFALAFILVLALADRIER